MNHSIQKSMISVGMIALTTDTALDSWALQETLAVNGNMINSVVLALGIGVVYLSIKIGFFLKAINVADDLDNPRRTAILGLTFGIALCFALVSTYFNLDRLAGDRLQSAYTQMVFDKRIKIKDTLEEYFKQAFEQSTNIQSARDSAQAWHDCEIANACISERGMGAGPISSLLNGVSLSADNALQSLVDLEGELEPLRQRSDRLAMLFHEVDKIAELNFDQKEERRNELSAKLHETVTDLQALIPMGVFNGLEQEMAKSTATYRALAISDASAKRLKTKFQPMAEEFARQATLMRHAQNMYVPPVKTPSRLEVLTSSSDGIVFWFMSLALAFGVWVMLLIHVLSVRMATPKTSTVQAS